MVWTCLGCGYNHGDSSVEELRTTGEIPTDKTKVTSNGVDTGEVIMKEVEGWECDRCGRFHAAPKKPPGEINYD